MGRFTRQVRRRAERENQRIFLPTVPEEGRQSLRAFSMERSLGSIERSRALHRDEARDVLARAEGYLLRELRCSELLPGITSALPSAARFIGCFTSEEVEEWSDAPVLPEDVVFVFEMKDRGKPRLLHVRSDWGEIGDRIACGERYHVLDDGTVEYEADLDPSTRPRTGYWKPAKNLTRSRTRIVLEVVDIQPIRIQEAVGSFPDIGSEEHLRSIWTRKYGGDSWDKNVWAWAIKYRRI